ncbi:hypothetical protein [Blastopirellula marina]|uniref:hypothetical protein n=1 Tax=Blastopirellula marina TaxID=124 RepID=UPI0011B03524|nr:hypothetical protein [Blastopirellula marina]
MDESRSDQPFRFGLIDLFLATTLAIYFCGVVTLGLAGVGADVLNGIASESLEHSEASVLATLVSGLLIGLLFVYVFALLTSPLWLVIAIISITLRPKLFLLANVLAVIAALVLPFFLENEKVETSLMVCLSLGAMPLGSAWIFHRWLLGLNASLFVNFWFFGLFAVQLSVIEMAGVLHAMAYW